MTAPLVALRLDPAVSWSAVASALRPEPRTEHGAPNPAADELHHQTVAALDAGHVEEAMALIERWRRIDSSDAPRVQLAVALAMGGRTAEAEEEVRAVLAGNLADGDAWGVLGFLLADQGRRTEEAIVALGHALALDPQDHLCRIIRAMLRAGAGDLDPAMADCAEIPADSDHFASSRRVWAAALGRLGRYAEGLRKLHELDETTLEGPEAATLRSWLLDEFFAERRDPHWGPRLPGKPQGLNPPIKLRGDGPLVSQMILDDRE